MHHSMRKSIAFAAATACLLAGSAHAATVTISNFAMKDENCTPGICTPTGPNPNIRVYELRKLLAHSDMKIVTGQGATDILVGAVLTWASRHRLTLDANQSIHIGAPIVVKGRGGITLVTNDGGSGGDYDFYGPTLTFWDTTSSLIINGQSFTLVKDITSLASGIAANPAGNFALANSYDASVDGTYASAPVQTTFKGAFEGLGAIIQNLTIASTKQGRKLGLFSSLDVGGTIRDINLINVTVSGSGTACRCWDEIAGTLVGINYGTISRTQAGGSVSEGLGRSLVGGLSGATFAGGTIARSSFSGNLSAAARGGYVGGIAGKLYGGTILQSVATVDIGNGYLVGGLVGEFGGTIMLSQAHGTVTGAAAGGLVGDGDGGGTIAQSFASVDVTTRDMGGGLIGDLSGTTITQSYSTGSVKGKGFLAGLAGYELGIAASEVYATGLVTDKVQETGGLIAYCQGGAVTAGYWDITTTKQNADTCGATGLTDAQLKSALPAGFDPNVWGQNASINNGWPFLLANPPQ